MNLLLMHKYIKEKLTFDFEPGIKAVNCNNVTAIKLIFSDFSATAFGSEKSKKKARACSHGEGTSILKVWMQSILGSLFQTKFSPVFHTTLVLKKSCCRKIKSFQQNTYWYFLGIFCDNFALSFC